MGHKIQTYTIQEQWNIPSLHFLFGQRLNHFLSKIIDCLHFGCFHRNLTDLCSLVCKTSYTVLQSIHLRLWSSKVTGQHMILSIHSTEHTLGTTCTRHTCTWYIKCSCAVEVASVILISLAASQSLRSLRHSFHTQMHQKEMHKTSMGIDLEVDWISSRIHLLLCCGVDLKVEFYNRSDFQIV